MSAPGSRVDDALAIVLLATGWVILALASHQWALLVPLLALIGGAPLLRGRVPLPSSVIAHGALAVPIVAHLQLRGVRGIAGNPFNTGFHAGYYALAAGALALLTADRRGRLPRVVLFAACALTATSVGVPTYLAGGKAWTSGPLGEATPGPRALYLGACAVFAVCAAAAYRRSLPAWRRKRPARAAQVAATVCFAATAAVGFGSVRLFEINYDAINRTFVELVGGRFPRTGSAGFSGRAELGSVIARQQAGGRDVALRGFARAAPGYVRGAAFTRYREGSWSRSRPAGGRQTVDGERLPLPGRPAGGADALSLAPEDRYGDTVFLPLEAAAVDGLHGEVSVDDAGVVALAAGGSARGYDVALDPAPVRAGAEDPATRELPEDPQLLAALDRALERFGLAPGLDAGEATLRLARAFDARYRYRFGIRFDRDRDPLVQFLEEKDHGHCELFASSGALLLRRLGFATRYVTGFVCSEPSPLEDGVWLARDQHAHAWIELLDPRRGWVVTELTPGDGLPQATPAQGTEAVEDWLATVWSRFTRWVRDLPANLGAALRALLARASGWGAWLALAAAALAAAALARAWRRRGEASTGPEQAPLAPDLEAERAAFLLLERRLARAGLGRRAAETLLEYANRLAASPPPEGLDVGRAAAAARRLSARRYAQTARA